MGKEVLNPASPGQESRAPGRHNRGVVERILYVTVQFPFGRSEAFLGAESRALAALADVTIAALRPQCAQPVASAGLPCWGMRTLSRSVLGGAFRTLRRQPVECAAIARTLLFSRYRPAAKVKNLLVLAKGLALADYVLSRRITAIHAHWLTTSSTAGFIAARLTKVALSISAHRFDIYADNLIAQKLACARFVRVISERGASDLRAQIAPELRDRVTVLHLGVDVPDRPASPPQAQRPLHVAAIGNLLPVKGHADLIDAIARVRAAGVKLSCSIIGEGPLRARLQASIERRDLAGIVTLRGFVPHAQVMAELQSGEIDVVAHPSIESGSLHEGIPVAMMEAMAFGIPCVATRTGSISELVDASCGILVEQRRPDALASALTLLATDAGARAALGRASRERIRAEFDAARNAGVLLGLIANA
jgi:glycosyltransferase involved in cell wall biosynthesis